MGNFFLVEGSNAISLKFDLDIIVSSMGNFFLVEGSNAISLKFDLDDELLYMWITICYQWYAKYRQE